MKILTLLFNAFLFIISFFLLTSCIDLLDDLTIHNDGTGTFKYTINLSSSKSKINSILALDTINGERVPDITEIEKKIINFKNLLSKQPGIKNVLIEYSFNDYIFKISCDFDNIKSLQSGIENSISSISGNKINETDWITWSNNRLERNIPIIVANRFENSSWIDTQLLSSGTYTSISRFDKEINSFTNSLSKISKNKTAIMTQVKTSDVFNNTQILKNKIILKEDE